MHLTRKADYGIRIVLELAKMPQGTTLPAKELARRQGIPLPFLSKIVADLASAKILETKRGAKGGVRLCIPPESISLMDVLEAVDGNFGLSYCACHQVDCYREPYCAIRKALLRVQRGLEEELRRITLASLAENELANLQQVNALKDELRWGKGTFETCPLPNVGE